MFLVCNRFSVVFTEISITFSYKVCLWCITTQFFSRKTHASKTLFTENQDRADVLPYPTRSFAPDTCHISCSIVAPLLIKIGEVTSFFTLFDIQHVIRSSNYQAYLSAKRVSTLSMAESWMNKTPSFFVPFCDCSANVFLE
jgi:hypothetical protein